MQKAHVATMARQSKSILQGALQLAVMSNALDTNPLRDVNSIKRKEAQIANLMPTTVKAGNFGSRARIELEVTDAHRVHPLLEELGQQKVLREWNSEHVSEGLDTGSGASALLRCGVFLTGHR